MKKLLLSLFVSVLAIFAYADDVTFDFTSADALEAMGIEVPAAGAGTTITGKEITVGNVCLTSTSGTNPTRVWSGSGNNAGLDLRAYKSGGSITFSTTDGTTITSIAFTSGDNSVVPSKVDVEDGTLADGKWTGEANTVTFKMTATVRVAKAVVTVSGSAPIVSTIDKPTFSLASGSYNGTQQLTITAAEGYGLIYTTDGATPEDGVGTYVTAGSATIDIAATTTVKAISVDNDDPDNASKVASVDITIVNDYNTAATALTVSQALEYIAAGVGLDLNVYTKGTVTKVDELSASFGNATYYISDGEKELEVYRGYGLDNAKMTSAEDLAVGDVVTVYGKLVDYKGTFEYTAGNYIVEQDKSGRESGGGSDEIEKISLADFLSKADTETTYELSGVVTKISNTTYGNLYIADDKGNELYIYGLLTADGTSGKFSSLDVAVNDTLTLQGVYTVYTPSEGDPVIQIKNAKFVSVAKFVSDEPLPKVTPLTVAELTNGGLEVWGEKRPEQWEPATTASSATISKSEDAHSGNYSVKMNGTKSNTRFASSEIILPAGYYTTTVYGKAGTTETACAMRSGYVVVKMNEDETGYETLGGGAYVYFNDGANVVVTADGWTESTNTFKLNEETIISLVVMNPKNFGDLLVDDFTIRAATAEEIEAYEIATGIASVSADKSDNAVYNLAGQRLSAPQKGINIIGGKKVYIK